MEKIISFLISPSFTGGLLILKLIFIFFAFLFLILIIYFLIKTTWPKRIFIWDLIEFFTYRPYGVYGTSGRWKWVLYQLEKGSENEAKLAVIETESILDETLKRLGFVGETFGERLEKITPDILPNLEEIREIHQIHQNIVHDPSYKLSLETAKKVIEVYGKALEGLGAI